MRGRIPGLIIMTRLIFTLWEVAHARYPEEEIFNEVLRKNERASRKLHLLGPVLLTHGRCIE